MKALREKRNELKSKLDSILKPCEIETRALTEEELKDYETIEANLKNIEATIEKMKGIKEGENTEMVKEKETETQTEETRAMEVRAMSTTTNVSPVPTNLSNDVIKKLEEQSTVVADVRKITVAGDYEQLVEKSTSGKAQILDEMEKLNAVDIDDFEKVKLTDKRVATEVVVSEKLINNAPVIAHGYIAEEISKRVARTLEDEIFNSNGATKHFGKGLIASGETLTGAITIDSIKDLVIGMNPTLLGGAKLYMNRETFAEVSKLKDTTGEYYVQLHTVMNEAPHYMVLGVKIEISDIIPADTIVLANVGQAYLLKQNGDMGVKMLVEKYSDVGCLGFLINTYFDGAVVNKQAVRVLKTATKTK
ncbi:phage major capsid protein [Clostridium botulinum]|uniref:phage major capsid protein n=1 Tax=Clostridium botulinum TaxID=1491 RepID=UPI00035E4DA1|nr:phage major capsid protein [Clostridium botulinum]